MKFTRTTDALASFLYDLMRDHVPTGFVEKIVVDVEQQRGAAVLHGPLGAYAEDLANRLHAASKHLAETDEGGTVGCPVGPPGVEGPSGPIPIVDVKAARELRTQVNKFLQDFHSPSLFHKSPEQRATMMSLQLPMLLSHIENYLANPIPEFAAVLRAKAVPFLTHIGKEDLLDGITTQAT